MKGINHLVLAGHDLEALRSTYQALGFTFRPRGELPFGISNLVIPLQDSYLELLSVTGPHPEHSPGHFSFGAFNRDYLARHEGFSMLVLDTTDARADILSWREAGLQVYEPFDFSRMAPMHDGEQVKLSFSLAFVSHPAAPWLGLFACQHYRPEFFYQPQYQNHSNAASTVQDVWIAGEAAQDLADFLSKGHGSEQRQEKRRSDRPADANGRHSAGAPAYVRGGFWRTGASSRGRPAPCRLYDRMSQSCPLGGARSSKGRRPVRRVAIKRVRYRHRFYGG